MQRLVFSCLVALCFVSPVRAGMLTFTDTRSTSDSFSFSGEGNGSLGSGNDLMFVLPQFNLGFTLQAVVIEYEVLSFSSQITVINNSSSETATFISADGTNLTPPVFPGNAGSGLSFLQSQVVSLGPGESRNTNGQISGPSTTNVNPSSFVDYIGSGDIVAGPQFSHTIRISNLSGLTDPNDLFSEGAASATVRATITYTFDGPDVVPEPSTFALLGIGGVALAGYGWRRKRQQAA